MDDFCTVTLATTRWATGISIALVVSTYTQVQSVSKPMTHEAVTRIEYRLTQLKVFIFLALLAVALVTEQKSSIEKIYDISIVTAKSTRHFDIFQIK